jgi:hypothetical protein
MDFCNTVDRLYSVLPVRRFRDWLIRAHIERCPRCQARLLSRDEARSLLVAPARLGTGDLWQKISAQAVPLVPVRESPAARGAIPWRWAAVTAMTAVMALAGFWLLRQVERPGLDGLQIASVERFELDYVKVGGAPAQTFVYQPQGTDTVFVWASKTP